LAEVARRNAELITRLPLEIREQMTAKAAQLQRQGLRGAALERELRTIAPHLTRNRIRLIARTEIGKAETQLSVTRAGELGIDWGVWETSQDSRVRKSHRHMNGVLVNAKDPPQPEKLVGEKSTLGSYLPGECPNCRCVWLPLASLDEVQWPARCHVRGRLERFTRSKFAKMAGLN
jgi:SPP1 gp7 family putative phage head morphogenesis protein